MRRVRKGSPAHRRLVGGIYYRCAGKGRGQTCRGAMISGRYLESEVVRRVLERLSSLGPTAPKGARRHRNGRLGRPLPGTASGASARPYERSGCSAPMSRLPAGYASSGWARTRQGPGTGSKRPDSPRANREVDCRRGFARQLVWLSPRHPCAIRGMAPIGSTRTSVASPRRCRRAAPTSAATRSRSASSVSSQIASRRPVRRPPQAAEGSGCGRRPAGSGGRRPARRPVPPRPRSGRRSHLG